MKSNPEIQALMNRISTMIQNQDENSPLEVLFSHYSEFCYTQNKSEASLQQDLRKTLHDTVPVFGPGENSQKKAVSARR